MNNSQVEEERALEDTTPQVRKAYLGRMIELIGRIVETADWKEIEKEVYGERIEGIERLIVQEAKKERINDTELYKLQGRLSEAKKNSLKSLLEDYKLEFKQYA